MQMKIATKGTTLRALALATLATVGAATQARAQWSRTYEQFYLPGHFNWTFRREYATADRLFNAFDYGHAILYERLYTRPGAPTSDLETDEYNFITQKLLVSPPNLPLEEGAIEINYAKMAPEAKMMFDWAHLLHRQIYDVLASEEMTQADKDAKIAELVGYYKTRPDLAFSSTPKNMDLMEGQPYSLAFRQRYPKFNGLIWAYHWLQVGLYEPLVTGKTLDERQTGVIAAVARFRQMLENAPSNMPRIMPMTAAIAPTFAARYPEAAIIFDNLHAMHDVVSDILTSSKVPANKKRAEILKAAARYRDATSFVMTPKEWMDMAQMMGVQNMGGSAVGVLAGLPEPTVGRGAVATNGNMAGMSGMSGAPGNGGAAAGGMNHAMPGMAGSDTSHAMAGMPGMAGMKAQDHDSIGTTAHGRMNMDSTSSMDMHMRLLSDPVIRERIAADTALRRMMSDMIGAMPSDHQAMMRRMLEAPAASATTKATPTKKATARKSTTKKQPATATKPAPKKPVDPMPGMDHSNMPGMGKP